MFRLNLKIAWRNLLKHKGYAAVNILGLALGLAGFIFMVLFVNHEKSYDTWDKQLENVYQVQEYSDYFATDKKAHWRNEIDVRLSRVITDLPQIDLVTVVIPENRKFGIKISDKPAFLQSELLNTDSLFFKVLPYEFKYGNAATALLQPNSIVLKEQVALKYFGDINPIGQKINVAGGSWSEGNLYTVTGVVKEPGTPSEINFKGVLFTGKDFINPEWNYGIPAKIYVKARPISDLRNVNMALQKIYLPVKDHYLDYYKSSLTKAKKEGKFPELKLSPLYEVHQHPLNSKSWRETLKPVILLCTLLLCVSIINFINLATAQASGRAKEIGVKKVVGAYRKSLIFQFLTETFIQTIISMFLGLLFIEATLPLINNAFSVDLILFRGGNFFELIAKLIAITVIAGLLAGIYPAIFISSFKPQQVLKGNFANGKSSLVLRKVLAGVQFVISVSFIIGVLIINLQLKFLKNRDNGFTPTGMITMKYGGGGDDYSEIKKLRRIDGVKYVSFSSGVIGDYMSNAYTYNYKGEKKELYGWGMGIDGMQALDARLISGRLFSRSAAQDTIHNAILNETAAKMFNEPMVGQTIIANDSIPINIIGVIKDIQVEGFEKEAKPTIYAVYTGKWGGVGFTVKPTTLVRFDLAKRKEVLKNIEKFFAEQNEFYPISYTLTEDDFSAVLAEHERFEKMILLFSFLSLALSLFGLFSLASFFTKQRIKEIAIRKVLGAENTDILILLNKVYVWIILSANAVAFPMAYILVNKWLTTFAYRIEISPVPFIIAFITSVTITIITVSLQAKKAINANPVKALKYE